MTEKEEKLLLRALDAASAESEYEKALLEWGKSVRANGVTGHDIIDLARVDHAAREDQIRAAAYSAGKAGNNSPAPAAPSWAAASSWLAALVALVPLCVAYIRRVAMIACAIGLGAVLHAGAVQLAAPREKTAPRAELLRRPDHPRQEAHTRRGRETFSF